MLEWNVRRSSSIVIENTHSIHSVVKMPTMNCKIYLQPITNNVVDAAAAAVAVPFFSFFRPLLCVQAINPPFLLGCYTKLAVLTLIANSFCNRILFHKTSTPHRSGNACGVCIVHILLLLHHFTIGQRHFYYFSTDPSSAHSQTNQKNIIDADDALLNCLLLTLCTARSEVYPWCLITWTFVRLRRFCWWAHFECINFICNKICPTRFPMFVVSVAAFVRVNKQLIKLYRLQWWFSPHPSIVIKNVIIKKGKINENVKFLRNWHMKYCVSIWMNRLVDGHISLFVCSQRTGNYV